LIGTKYDKFTTLPNEEKEEITTQVIIILFIFLQFYFYFY